MVTQFGTEVSSVQAVYAIGKPPDNMLCIFKNLKNVVVLPSVGKSTQPYYEVDPAQPCQALAPLLLVLVEGTSMGMPGLSHAYPFSDDDISFFLATYSP